jgi:hypothetical protein
MAALAVVRLRFCPITPPIYPPVTAQQICRGPDEAFESRWSPERRASGSRRQRWFLAAYQAARREFFEGGAVVGGRILVVDTDLNTVCGHDLIVPPTQH